MPPGFRFARAPPDGAIGARADPGRQLFAFVIPHIRRIIIFVKGGKKVIAK